jgi:hypothetical protein
LQGKGNESEDEQVMDVLVIFTDNRLFLLQAVAPKTAPGTRVEKTVRRFPTTNRFKCQTELSLP